MDIVAFLGWFIVFMILFTLFPPLGALVLIVFALGMVIMLPFLMLSAMMPKCEKKENE